MEQPKPLPEKQFAAMSASPGPKRYKHFVGYVADRGFVWGLRDTEGWVGVGDKEGNEGIPFWPHPEYAQACASGEWAGNQPSPIEIHDFLGRWLPNMEKDGVMVAVFPTPTLQGVFVPAFQLGTDIRDELSRIE